MERSAQLVYQVGIANVFLSEGEGMDSKRTRVYQGDYRSAENISKGIRLAGVPVTVWHCDMAGDIALQDWLIGKGELWEASKHCEFLESSVVPA